MENSKVALNEDEKAVVEREIKSTYGAMSTLFDWVKKDSLTEEMRETLLKLVEHHVTTIKKATGFTGEESEREKEIAQSIGQYYQEQIRDLERALESQGTIGSISANVQAAFKKIDKWWDIEGFHYIGEKQVAHTGVIKMKLGFMLGSSSSAYSDTPVSDKSKLKTKVQYLEEKGYQFVPKTDGYDLDLIDNDLNRRLLENMIEEAFPSAVVWSYENRLRQVNNKQDHYVVLRGVKVTIYDLNDIESLHIEERSFLVDD